MAGLLAGLVLALAGCTVWPAGEPGREHFVDGSRPAGGDGRSWETAWRSFAEIDWPAFGPGDVLTISGGSRGRVYRETLDVGASGGNGRPIVIRAAPRSGHGADQGADHGGAVVIDAQNRRANGIRVEGRDQLTIRDLEIRNVGDAGVRIRGATAGVLVEGVSVSAGNPHGRGNARGFDVRDSSGVVLRNNRYTTPQHSRAQNDGIFSMGNDDVAFIENRLIIRNDYQGPDEGHNDCIQSWRDHDIRIIGNYCAQQNTKRGHSLGIFVQNISGTALVVDNVVWSPNTRSACIAVENLPGFPTEGRLLAYHNTAYGCASGTLHIIRSPGSEAFGNILVSPAEDAQALKIVPPAPPAAKLDHNLLFTPKSSSPVFVEGSGSATWRAWRRLGHEAHGIFGDPRFVDAAAGDLRLAPTSIASGRAPHWAGDAAVWAARWSWPSRTSDLGAVAGHRAALRDTDASAAGVAPPQVRPASPSTISKRDNG